MLAVYLKQATKGLWGLATMAFSRGLGNVEVAYIVSVPLLPFAVNEDAKSRLVSITCVVPRFCNTRDDIEFGGEPLKNRPGVSKWMIT